MSQVTIYGVPPSSYVRSARMACAEKGVEHTFEPVNFQSDSYAALHPFRKVPAFQHGDVMLYETSAIARYIDAAFDGPPLFPSDAAAIGRVEQWISAINSYMYPDLIARYALVYIFAGEKGPDMDKIAAAQDNLKRDLWLLDDALSKHEFLGSDTVTFADILAAPILMTVGVFPEGKEAIGHAKNIQRFLGAIQERPSAKYLVPDLATVPADE